MTSPCFDFPHHKCCQCWSTLCRWNMTHVLDMDGIFNSSGTGGGYVFHRSSFIFTLLSHTRVANLDFCIDQRGTWKKFQAISVTQTTIFMVTIGSMEPLIAIFRFMGSTAVVIHLISSTHPFIDSWQNGNTIFTYSLLFMSQTIISEVIRRLSSIPKWRGRGVEVGLMKLFLTVHFKSNIHSSCSISTNTFDDILLKLVQYFFYFVITLK